MSNYDKGSRGEHELMELFEEHGFAVMRSAGSGKGGLKVSGEEREAPDVLAGNGETFYALESKRSSRDNHVYIPEKEMEALTFFCEKFGAEPRIAVRFDYGDWGFFLPYELYKTDGGNFRIKEEDIEDAMEIGDIV